MEDQPRKTPPATAPKIQFNTRCPAGHPVDVVFEREALKASLGTPRSDYFCDGCGRCAWRYPVFLEQFTGENRCALQPAG